MPVELSIQYRGPLRDCNFSCWYCPVVKSEASSETVAEDIRGLSRFVRWVQDCKGPELSVFFTPLGEALHSEHYQQAIVKLSNLPQIRRVAVQTNLSCELSWLSGCSSEKLAFWCSFHPNSIPQAVFLDHLAVLRKANFRFSVGMVGVKENFDKIAVMRQILPLREYLWVNRYKHEAEYYTAEDIAFLCGIDPLFHFSDCHASKGCVCQAGSTVVSLDHEGRFRRCHFVAEVMGNIYEGNLPVHSIARACVNANCSCHIGYVHLEKLGLRDVFGEGILERIPCKFL